MSLPIDTLYEPFQHELMQGNVVVEADTGSGKSTRLPLWAAEQGRVLVIEPRRIACTSLAEYLAAQSGAPLGKQIGYAIKLQAHFDDTTPVVFVTPGVALRWFAEDKLAQFDIVIVDEFHERRWDIDLLTSLLLQHAQHKLVVTSATLDGQRLADYLKASRLQSEGRNFPVTVAHQARESRDLPLKRGLESAVAQTVIAQLANAKGDVLVFLPGRKEIAQCASLLRQQADILVAPLHASVSDSARQLALTPQAQRKVVLATNVAETSLTIPNVEIVIDSGLERRTTQRNGRTTLVLSTISQASAKQRAGRAGRTMPGRCIRLYGQHAALVAMTPPELQREELHEAMLAAACCGYRLSDLSFLDPLPDVTLQKAQQQLLALKAIDDKGLATEHGQQLYPLPVDTLYADLITKMPTRALKEVMVDLAAGLSVQSNLYQMQANEEQLEQLAQQEPLGCDAALLVRLIRGEQFAAIQVDDQAMMEARGLAAQMREVFELPQLDVASRFDHVAWVSAIAHAHPELFYVRRVKRQEAFANGYGELLLGRNSRMTAKSEAALVLDTHSLPGRGVKQTLTIGSVMMPAPLLLCAELGLGEWQESKLTLDADAQRGTQTLVFAGRIVAQREIALEGEHAISALVQRVASGEYLPGLAEQVSQQAEHWRLFVAMGLHQGQVDKTQLAQWSFEIWFEQQLSMLGVTSVEEIALFSAEDFPFEGIPDWQYAEFAEQFPLQVALSDLLMSVEYHPTQKLVYVVHQSGKRKDDPKRWELPRFSGWRVKYRKASRIIDVR